MEIRATEQDGIDILALAGRMDATTTPEFESAARALLAQGKNRSSLIWRIWNISVPPACAAYSACQVDQGRIRQTGLLFPATHAAEVFRISGFNAMLTVCGSREEALRALRS